MSVGETTSILLVDPDADLRRRLRALIRDVATDRKLEVRVAEASDGTTALASMSEHRPALVLTEILLEGLSGLALLRHARQEQRTKSAFVFVTSLDREVDRYWGLRNGAHAYVTKPFKDEAVRRWIERLLTQGPNASPERPSRLG